MLTRIGEARDWGTGVPLKKESLGAMNQLEVHHIFPKALLYKHGYQRPEVNAVANFCFLTKDTNLHISDRRPEDYFPEVEQKHPGALASQWIPTDPQLWQMEHYHAFLQARRELLAEAANRFMIELLHGDTQFLRSTAPVTPSPEPATEVQTALGSIDSEEEETQLNDLNRWVTEHGLAEGNLMYELADPDTGNPVAVLDLAWPDGLQEGLGQPVAILINEDAEVLTHANQFGFRCFTHVEEFRRYVEREVLAGEKL